MRRVNISNIEGKPAVCFETGLDPRSFARTKMSQSMIETGFIVHPDGTHEIWRAAGVNEENGLMRVWGPLFNGKRLDLLINESDSPEAQQAALLWIRAKMFLGETHSTLNPGAAFICYEDGKELPHPKGSVFFAPENLSNRCLFVEGSEIDRYNCPDLTGMEAAAFCAGVMLYMILTGVHPYPSKEIFQDMREGVFLPVNIAAPGLNEKLAGLINAALLLPVAKKRTSKSGTDILAEILELLMNKEGKSASISSLFHELSAEKTELVEKEKKFYLFKLNYLIKANRFAVQNKHALLGSAAGLLLVFILIFSTVKSFSRRPTTEGMEAYHVIAAYYDAFSFLNHTFMEACIQGADKSDINVAVNFFAINKAREAYEGSPNQSIIPAKVWKDTGGELPSPNVFGVTDLVIEKLGGSEDENVITYRANYLLWAPTEDYASNRSDVLTLKRDKRKNWRIIEILRTEK